ncbi:MAG: TIGR02117 family protein [Candidatus Kapaibacterium sp.]
MIKRILKITAWGVGGFIGFVGLYMGLAYVLSRMSVEREQTTEATIPVYIKTNGVHTDIVVPVHTDVIDWSKQITYANTKGKDTTAEYLGMGWGDKGFYLETPTWADLTAKTAFKAMFGLSTTAIHATFHNTLTENDSCKKILLSKQQYIRLVTYIRNDLQTDSAGNVRNIVTNANYGLHDAFYEAHGTYSLFHTCNTWANNALKSCGQKACVWTPFDTGIFYQYK